MTRNSLKLLVLGLVAVVYLSPAAKAGFLTDFTGNSQTQTTNGNTFPPAVNPTADGLINFAVYENVGGTGDWVADLGVFAQGMFLADLTVGAGPVDTAAKYVYFYQVVNTNPVDPDDPITEIQIERGQFDTGGFLTDTTGGLGPGVPVVFNELTDGATGPSGNTAIGPAPATDTAPGNNVPGYSGGSLASTPFVADSTAVLPDNWNLLSIVYEFEFPTIPTASYSAVMFMTSDFAPSYLFGELHDTGITNGDIPSNTPEPGTFLMTFAAIGIGLAAAYCRRVKA